MTDDERKKKSPQNTTHPSPPQHEPTQRLTQHTTTKPNIPPRTFPPHHPPPTPLPFSSLIHPNPPRHINPLNLPATTPREERPRRSSILTGSGAGSENNKQEMKKARDEDRAEEIEYEALSGLEGENAGAETEEEGG